VKVDLYSLYVSTTVISCGGVFARWIDELFVILIYTNKIIVSLDLNDNITVKLALNIKMYLID